MAGVTSRFGIPLISGGSDDPDPDEIADAKQINDGFKAIDDVLGVVFCTSTTRPSTPREQTLIFEVDTGTLLLRSSGAWITVTSTATAIPVGTIFSYGAATAPAGYFLCTGSSLLRSTYQSLFNVIGTQFGAADATRFNVPNLRGRVVAGFDVSQAEFTSIGKIGGEKKHVQTIDELASHSHLAPTGAGVSGAPYEVPQGLASAQQSNYDYIGSAPTQVTGGGAGFNVLQPYMSLNYIIKF